MERNPFDNLPNLSKEEAFDILSKPIQDLELSSDYYKAVFHLLKYPGPDTEKVLLDFLKSNSDEQYVLIAQRKAIEVLARHRSINAIPFIINCLQSNDKYIVENASWALQELDCKDPSAIELISNLLDDPNQNRRVLIQSLGNLGAVSEISHIKLLLEDKIVPPSVKGAAIAAVKKLTGDSPDIDLLVNHLSLPNQNERQCAVNDVIDSGAIDLLPMVLKTPVAPSFRMRAMNLLWPENISSIGQLELLPAIDSLILDDPNDLELINEEQLMEDESSLANSLCNPDFRRSCIALRSLCEKEADYIWRILSPQLDYMKKDYGALYFLMILFRSVQGWEKNQLHDIKAITLSCLSSNWPDYIKFKPVAILTLIKLFPASSLQYISGFLDEAITPFWASRYASLMGIELYLLNKEPDLALMSLKNKKEDTHRFVRCKLNKTINSSF